MRCRSKYNAWGNLPKGVKRPVCEYCGFKHDSILESKFCEHLHLLMKAGEAVTPLDSEIVWIDVFPVITLDQDGEKWKLDFCTWTKQPWPHPEAATFYDVKGFETPEFKRKRKKFDRRHPAAPLVVVKRKGRGWIYE